MIVKPNRDYVLILVDLRAELSASGLIALPAHYGPPPGSGVVVASGPGRHVLRGGQWVFRANDVKAGDRVGYRWIDVGESRTWEHEGKKYVFLREHELYLVTQQEASEPKAA